MKKTVMIELTKAERQMVLDALDILSPDSPAREKQRSALWDKIARETSKSEVIVVVEGGLCTEVHSNRPIEVTVLDFDDERPDENEENDAVLKKAVDSGFVRGY